MQKWGVPQSQGGLHWATYKATCRRHGVFRINMNEALVAPIFEAVATHWEKAFVTGLQQTLAALETEVQAELKAFHQKLRAALAAAAVPAAAAAGVDGAQSSDGLLTALQGAVSELKEAASKEQRDLSRSMEPMVQQHMTTGCAAARFPARRTHRPHVTPSARAFPSVTPPPTTTSTTTAATITSSTTTPPPPPPPPPLFRLHHQRPDHAAPALRRRYDVANAEAGTGSHRRRVAKLEAHVEREAPKMFDAAAKAIVERLEGLRKDIGGQLERDVVQASLRTLLTAYTPLWDEFGEGCLEARQRMRQKCSEMIIETQNAVRRLAGSNGTSGRDGGGGGAASASSAGGGSAGGGGGDDDDDDVVETTAEHQKEKRQRQLEETIDLSGESDDALLPMQTDQENKEPQGPVTVKPEAKA